MAPGPSAEREVARRARGIVGHPTAFYPPESVTGVTKVTELAEKSRQNPRNDAESRVVVGTFEAVERPTGVSPSKSTRCDGPSSLEE